MFRVSIGSTYKLYDSQQLLSYLEYLTCLGHVCRNLLKYSNSSYEEVEIQIQKSIHNK